MSDVESRVLSLSGHAASLAETLSKPVPTVFIALGGSGKDVVMRLRKRFFDRFRTKDPGYAQFVFIDTDNLEFVPRGEKAHSFAELQPDQNEVVPVPITEAQFHRVFADLRAKVNCDDLSWLKPEMERLSPQALEHGSGTHRQFGRLAFYLNHASIRHTIQRQIAHSLRHAAENFTKVEENRIEVVIVMSLAGGTGSGMFIDVAYLVQDILNMPNYRSLRSRFVTLISFLPGLFEEHYDLLPRFQQNAFAALMELEYYGTPRTGDELLLGDYRNGGRQDHRYCGFTAIWGDSSRRFIRGPGWDNCYLIDNRNDLDPNSPLTDRDVFQMTADYLFLDFENHEFAVAKRSMRTGLVKFKYKVKETWVRRPNNPPTDTSIFEGNAVYANQNGCGFSSFGLAEIYSDIENLYQVAAYRLAALLIRSRWLGSADGHPESQYTAWVKEHLIWPKGKPDQDDPPSFHPDWLTRRLLTTPSSCWLDELKRDMDPLSESEPKEGLGRLIQALNTHARRLGVGARRDNGDARQAIEDNLVQLRGDATTLGPLRTRLRQLAAGHCALHGVTVTLWLLDRYRSAFNHVRDRVRTHYQASEADDTRLLARLKEAQMVPWPVKSIAVAIEFSRACRDVGRALQLRYDKAAAWAIERMVLDLSRYIGAPDQPSYPELVGHGTLHGYYTRAQTFVKTLAERLEKRFKLSHDYDPFRVVRRRSQSLGPNWDEATFDASDRSLSSLVFYARLCEI